MRIHNDFGESEVAQGTVCQLWRSRNVLFRCAIQPTAYYSIISNKLGSQMKAP